MPAQTVIKFRRDTAANWATANSVLAAGEVGLETDSGLVKYGNGTSVWADLQYTAASSLKTKVQNSTASTIAKGSVVYISGASGDNPLISLADADSEATSSKTIGLVQADILSGAQGYVIESGLITNLDTSAATAGQSVWLSSTAGGVVYGNPPAKPAHSVYLGVVTRVNANNGSILVQVQNGYELNELHDVDAGSPVSGDVLQWNGTAWVNAEIVIPPGTTVSENAPASPEEGRMWWNSDSGTLYIYYDSVWVEAAAGVVGPEGPQGIQGPAGNDGAISPNYIINGGFDIWQRGTSFNHAAFLRYADRWQQEVASGIPSGTITRESFPAGDLQVAGLGNSNFFQRINITAANSCTIYRTRTKLEDVGTLAGQTVTLSFYYKGTTNQVAEINIIQTFGSGGSSPVVISQANYTPTSAWQRYTNTFTMPSIAGKTIGTNSMVEILIDMPKDGSLVQVGQTDIWGVQLEAGSVATPFRRNANSIQGELAACQRYFERLSATAANSGAPLAFGFATSTTTAKFKTSALVVKRAAPSFAFTSGTNFRVWDGVSAAPTTTSMSIGAASLDSVGNAEIVAVVASGLTQFRPVTLIPQNFADTFIDISAEL